MIIKSIWFAGDHCIGIVQIVQDHEKDTYRQTGMASFKYYIGVGQGQNEKADAQHIADYGVPFDSQAGDVLFGVLR
jgi:hypothetical protein